MVCRRSACWTPRPAAQIRGRSSLFEMRFANQVAIVTGAGRGIGHAVAARLASEGARIACVSRTEVNARRTSDELNAAGGDIAKAYSVDVSDHAAVESAG